VTLATIGVFVALVVAVSPSVAAASEAPPVLQFWYRWAQNNTFEGGVWNYAATNLTLQVEVTEANGTQVEEITEFLVQALTPFRSSNGSSGFPWPMIGGVYNTLQIQRGSGCRWINETNDPCGAPNATWEQRVVWEHQVLEIRFMRLLEFRDSDGDGGYTPGEPILSQLDLADPAFRYAGIVLEGQNLTRGPQALPVRIHYEGGPAWEGWLRHDDTGFADFDGLTFRMSATGPANVTIAGYQWFRPRVFQGVNLTPFQAKLDLTIADYPFVDPDSRLAWELNFTSFSQGSSTDWELVPWPEGQAIGADSANTTAIFAWASNATADGVSTRVSVSVVTVDDHSRHVFLGYPQANLIHHDPVLGITDKRIGALPDDAMPDGVVPPSFSLNTAWIAFIATLAVAALAIYTTERRKR
jgi:hypothetical protein